MISSWPIKKLREICEFQNGIWKGKKPPFKKISVIRNVNFLNRGLIDFDNLEEIEVEERFYKTHLLQKGDLILERSGGGPDQPVGRVAYFEKEGKYTFSNFTTRIRVKNLKEIDPKYLWAYLHFLYELGITKSLQSHTTGIRNLDFKAYQNLQIPLPPLPIQQKIVSILDTIQSAIEVQEEIIEKTKELKKSIMAELFKYGGPSFRKGRKLKKTEIGEIPEDWEVVRLGEVAKIKTGKSNVQDAKDEGNYLFFDRSGQIKKSDKYLFDKEAVIIPGEGKEFVPKYYKGKFDLHQRAYAIFDFSKLLHGEYLFYIMEMFSREFIKLAVGTTVKSLRLPMFKNFQIPLPPLPEQCEIARILQTIDQKIEIEKKKKELYEELFKTMLNKIMNQEIDVERIKI